MPTVGEMCGHGCPECGEPMFWSEAVVHSPDLLARSARPVDSTIVCVDAYRCDNGHISKECPLCGSYDTVAWRDTKGAPHYHVICGTCGNDGVTP